MEVYGKGSFISEGVQIILLDAACASRKLHILSLGAICTSKRVHQNNSKEEGGGFLMNSQLIQTSEMRDRKMTGSWEKGTRRR